MTTGPDHPREPVDEQKTKGEWTLTISLTFRSKDSRGSASRFIPDSPGISRIKIFDRAQREQLDPQLVTGQTIGIDATTLEANAALRSIVRRDTGESYDAFLTRLAEASGIATPTRGELARFDKKRKKKGSNDDWMHPQDPDAKITKMKDGRTHLAHKAEHAIDLDTGAVVSVTVQDADEGDTSTMVETRITAAEQVEAVLPVHAGLGEIVADKGYHSNHTLTELGRLVRADRRIHVDWPRHYHLEPWLVETLVDPRCYHGGCYRTNWVALGATSGRGRMDRHRRRAGVAPKTVLVCRWDKAGRMRDKPLWLLWFLRGAAACPPAAAAHRQVPLATPQACRLARRYAPDRRQRARRTEARLAREPVSVVRVWAAPCGAVVLSSGPYAPESRHPAYSGRSRDQNF